MIVHATRCFMALLHMFCKNQIDNVLSADSPREALYAQCFGPGEFVHTISRIIKMPLEV